MTEQYEYASIRVEMASDATLRDKFAMAALNGCLSHSDTSNVAFSSVKEAADYYAKLAYVYADAMLKARG